MAYHRLNKAMGMYACSDWQEDGVGLLIDKKLSPICPICEKKPRFVSTEEFYRRRVKDRVKKAAIHHWGRRK